jgi:hypothetical protein
MRKDEDCRVKNGIADDDNSGGGDNCVDECVSSSSVAFIFRVTDDNDDDDDGKLRRIAAVDIDKTESVGAVRSRGELEKVVPR